MSVTGRERLYSPELLALAVRLANYPLSDELPLVGEARSRTCGSAVTCGVSLSGRAIDQIGVRVSACAVGQAAAAIFAANARGCSEHDLTRAESQIAAWLDAVGALPEWPGIEQIAAAIPFPARHAAILLPWNAATRALCKA